MQETGERIRIRIRKEMGASNGDEAGRVVMEQTAMGLHLAHLGLGVMDLVRGLASLLVLSTKTTRDRKGHRLNLSTSHHLSTSIRMNLMKLRRSRSRLGREQIS